MQIRFFLVFARFWAQHFSIFRRRNFFSLPSESWVLRQWVLVEGKKKRSEKSPHEMLRERKKNRSRNAEKENAIKEKALNRILSQTCIILFMAFYIFILFSYWIWIRLTAAMVLLLFFFSILNLHNANRMAFGCGYVWCDTTKWWKDIPTFCFFFYFVCVFANIATSNLAIDLM